MTAQDTHSRISTDPEGGWDIEVLYSPHGEQVGERRTLLSGRLVVSRVGSADPRALELADASISRDSVHFELAADGIRLVDRGSRNPVTIDGLAFEGARSVAPGSLVRLGNTLLGVWPRLLARPLDLLQGDPTPVQRAMVAVRDVLRLGSSPEGQHALYDIALIEPAHRVLVVEGDPGDVLVLAQWLAQQRGLQLTMQMPTSPTDAASILTVDRAAFVDLSACPPGRDRLILAALGRRAEAVPQSLVVCALRPPASAHATEVASAGDVRRYLHTLCDATFTLPALPQRRLDVAHELGRVLARRRSRHSESATFIEDAVRYPWIGGVGELNRVIERLQRLVERDEPLDGPAWPFTSRRNETPRAENVTAEGFASTFARAAGNMTEVARELGVSRTFAYRVAERLGLDLEVLRGQIPARPGNRSPRVRSNP